MSTSWILARDLVLGAGLGEEDILLEEDGRGVHHPDQDSGTAK